ncbi:3-phosphoshikimate 1-carboxyvinyltransferase [Rothia sp. ZJ1223]|uniref:3-phosphoshikimate 1-carboxyvinyltransferase n=1 Tax=Rothia sp. ZJ1223 TaxID=2811098 RepID=UPI0019589C2E|nr:3-phosphoshikimate 1-carboxyvinyltransferase [Rothia sp. ZJ1223]MBM7051056.1 3-phosphoshikimate 1-carboxyvinyltransferase [Rothia sp. ZJ1223]
MPQASGRARVQVPGSKSLTNRYLLLAALASSESVIHAPLHSRDSALMIAALEALGACFTEVKTGSPFGPDLRVTPLTRGTSLGDVRVDVGLAGTVMRFVPPVAALVNSQVHFDGDEHAYARPMLPVIDALRSLGVSVDDGGSGSLPFTVEGFGRVERQELSIDASGSSQFVSALLLAGASFAHGLTLKHSGKPIPSMPHVEMTVEVLRSVGLEIDDSVPNQWRIEPQRFPGFEVTIEPDLSNAGPFIGAAVITGGTVEIPHWPAETTQGGDHWRSILPLFGATVEQGENSLTVTGADGGLYRRTVSLDLDLSEAGELAPTVAALAALCEGTSVLRGIAHLRGHETDRLAALTAEINRLGGTCEETEDGIRITAPVQKSGTVRTYADHRMATAAAMMGLAVEGIIVENVETTSKTLPNFTGLWSNMLAELQKGA